VISCVSQRYPVSPSKAQDAAESRYMMTDRAHFEFVGVSGSEVQL